MGRNSAIGLQGSLNQPRKSVNGAANWGTDSLPLTAADEEDEKFRRELVGKVKKFEQPTVSKDLFLQYLESDLEQEASCLSLPFAGCFLLVFVVVMNVHEQINLTYLLETSLRNEVLNGMSFDRTKSFHDISDVRDFWTWMKEGVVPRIWIQNEEGKRLDYRGESIHPSMWDRMVMYNKIVGAIRLEQTRSQQSTCDLGKMPQYYGTSCHPTRLEDGRQFGKFGSEFLPVPNSDPPMFSYWLDAMASPEAIWQDIEYLSRGEWIDVQTNEVNFKISLYNSELSNGIFCEIDLRFQFLRSGLIKKKITLSSLHAEPYHHMEVMIMDFVFLSFIFYLFVGEMKELVPAVKEGKVKQYCQFWNVIDWISILLGFVLVLMWLIIVSSTADLTHILARVEQAEFAHIKNEIPTLYNIEGLRQKEKQRAEGDWQEKWDGGGERRLRDSSDTKQGDWDSVRSAAASASAAAILLNDAVLSGNVTAIQIATDGLKFASVAAAANAASLSSHRTQEALDLVAPSSSGETYSVRDARSNAYPQIPDISNIRNLMHNITHNDTWGFDRLAIPEVRGMYDDFFDGLGFTLQIAGTYHGILAFYVLVLMFRFFKSFASQPRLALMTDTLRLAFVEIVHFILVFLTIFLTYAVAGVILFGNQMEDFHTIFRSTLTSFEILFGAFDFWRMFAINNVYAILWFWTYMFLVFLVLLNMLLAIIMDRYGDVKAGQSDTLTLWAQASRMLQRQRETNLGQRIALTEVMDVVEKHEFENDEITAEALVRLMDRLPILQADSLVGSCRSWIRSMKPPEGLGITDTLHLCFILEQSIKGAAHQLQNYSFWAKKQREKAASEALQRNGEDLGAGSGLKLSDVDMVDQ